MSIRNRNTPFASLALALLTSLGLPACGDDDCDLATIQGRLDGAAAGDRVRIPGCGLEGALVVPAGVTLVGEDDATLAVTDPLAIGVELGAGARLEGLDIEAGGRAAVVARGDASVADIDIDLRHGTGLYFVGGTADVSDVTVTGPVTAANATDATWVNVLPEPGAAASCSVASCACVPGTIVSDTEICDSTGETVTWAPTIGIYTRGATLSLSNVSVAGIARYGLVSDDSAVTWTGGEVRDVVGVGLLLRGGSSDLTDLTVSRIVSGLRGVPSYGVLTTEGHDQATSRVSVREGERFGLVSLDGRGDHGDLSIDDNGDVGLWVSGSDGFAVTGSSAVESSGLSGVLIIDSTGVMLDGLRVADTATVTRSVGTFGLQTIGDGVQLVGANEALLRDVTVSGNERVGILADVVPGLTFENVDVSASGTAFGALGGTASTASGQITVDTGLAWDTGITRMGAAAANDAAASGAFDALVEGRPDGADSVVGIVGPMY